jgi:hypothetical protein
LASHSGHAFEHLHANAGVQKIGHLQFGMCSARWSYGTAHAWQNFAAQDGHLTQ